MNGKAAGEWIEILNHEGVSVQKKKKAATHSKLG